MAKWFTRMVACAAVAALASAAFTGELSPQTANKLDARLRLLLSPPLAGSAFAKAPALASNGAAVQVLIKTSADLQTLRARGAQIVSTAGDIVTAVVPLAQLEGIANLSEVAFIEASKSYKLFNDVGRVQTGAAAVQQQYNFTGKGVIVGVLDSGIDWRHDDFRKANGQTRIKYLLDFSIPGDTNGDGRLEGSGPFGGTLYTETQINAALSGNGTVTEVDRNGHGTHVTGSAAGNGRGTSNGVAAGTYAGVASEADLIFVKSRNGDRGSIPDIDAINASVFIDSVAKVLGEPYVINFSFGGHEGAHDGTSLQEQALDNLVGANRKGKAIVVAAGNEGLDSLHAGGSINGAVTINVRVPAYTAQGGASNDYVLFDCWYSGNANLSFSLTSPSGITYGPVTGGAQSGSDQSSGAVFIDNAKGGVNPLNASKEAIVQVFDNTANKPPLAGIWKLTISGTTNRYDVWLHTSSMGARLASNVSFSRLVGMPGTAKNVITVGAWASKKSWTDLDNHSLTVSSVTVGAAADFSSPGPSRDGRIKPEISAPGQMIGSTLSVNAPPSEPNSIWSGTAQYSNAFILRDNRHAIGNGTSFAAPLVAGGIALLLQGNPNLDAVQIRTALAATAKTDGFTGAVPNDKWGYGKVDFLSALSTVTGVATGEESPRAPQAFALLTNYPNPFNPSTAIAYQTPYAAHVEIAIFDMLGRRVRMLNADPAAGGRFYLIWDGRNAQGQPLTSGVYVYKMQARDFVSSRKMILLR